MSTVDNEPTDGFATFMCLLCWLGYLGLGAAYTFRQPGWAFAALVVIVVAYSIAAYKERRA